MAVISWRSNRNKWCGKRVAEVSGTSFTGLRRKLSIYSMISFFFKSLFFSEFRSQKTAKTKRFRRDSYMWLFLLWAFTFWKFNGWITTHRKHGSTDFFAENEILVQFVCNVSGGIVKVHLLALSWVYLPIERLKSFKKCRNNEKSQNLGV